MSQEAVASFFTQVHSDKSLQGALHFALAKSAPEVIVEIARQQGHSFTADDLASVLEPAGAEVAEAELEDVVGGAFANKLSSTSLRSNLWSNVSRFKPGNLAASFDLTIPGPSFVLVMGGAHDGDSPRSTPAAPVRSALELLEEVSGE